MFVLPWLFSPLVFFDHRRLREASPLRRNTEATLLFLLVLVTGPVGLFFYLSVRSKKLRKLDAAEGQVASLSSPRGREWWRRTSVFSVLLFWALIDSCFSFGTWLAVDAWIGPGASAGWQESVYLLLALLNIAILLLGIRLFATRHTGWSFSYCLSLAPARVAGLAGVTIFAIVAGGTLIVTALEQLAVFSWEDPEAVTLFNVDFAYQMEVAPIVLFVQVVLVAPVVEELLFRGYFFRILEWLRGPWTAFLVTGIVFWALHIPQYLGMSLLFFVFSLPFFFLFGAVRLWTGSVRPAILAHCLANLAGVAFVPLLALGGVEQARLELLYAGYSWDQQTEARLLERLESHPEDVRAMDRLATRWMVEGAQPARALELIERACEIKPDSPWLQWTRSRVLAANGRFEEAVEVREALNLEYSQFEFLEDGFEEWREAVAEKAPGRNSPTWVPMLVPA